MQHDAAVAFLFFEGRFGGKAFGSLLAGQSIPYRMLIEP